LLFHAGRLFEQALLLDSVRFHRACAPFNKCLILWVYKKSSIPFTAYMSPFIRLDGYRDDPESFAYT
ncbi:MAG: hypothetical protein ACLT98_08665, partial [Eggerthellaceae bacterium]